MVCVVESLLDLVVSVTNTGVRLLVSPSGGRIVTVAICHVLSGVLEQTLSKARMTKSECMGMSSAPAAGHATTILRKLIFPHNQETKPGHAVKRFIVNV